MSASVHDKANANSIEYDGSAHLSRQQGTTLLAGIHQEQELTALLWRTIQEDLFEFLRIQPDSGLVSRPIHDRNILLNLLNKAIDMEIENRIRVRCPWHKEVRLSESEEPPRIGPKRRWTPPHPIVRDPQRLPPDPQKRREEQDHFLGGGNPRRPSKN